MDSEQKEVKQPQLTQEQIEECIAVLDALNTDTNQIFEIPKNKRLALIKAAGLLSRPSRDEFSRRKKDSIKAAKRKQAEKDRHARNGTGIRSAREATIFIAPTMIALTGEEVEKELELKSPRNCYVCKAVFNKLHHFPHDAESRSDSDCDYKVSC